MSSSPKVTIASGQPLLRNGVAFACVLERGGDTLSARFAFENYGPVWGGWCVYRTFPPRDFWRANRRTVLAELTRRGLTSRYQVEADNKASIALAQSSALRHSSLHSAHEC